MDDLRGYRIPAPPAPERFPLRMGTGARIGLAVSVGALALSVVLFVLTGRLFLLFFAAFGPGLYYVLAGAPRSLDVHHDAAVIRSWLRAPRRFPGAELSVELDDEALVLTGEHGSLALATEHFDAPALERCAQALRPIARRFVDRRC